MPRSFASGVNPALIARHAPPQPTPARGGSKYGAQRTEYNGRVYDSKAEAAYREHLDGQQDVTGVLEQVPFRLPGGTIYRADFLVFWRDGTATVDDVKGMETDVFKVKWREVKAAYPWMTFRTIKKRGQDWEVG